MAADLDVKARSNGGLLSALAKKLFGGESLFVNELTNNNGGVRRVTLVQATPGDMLDSSASSARWSVPWRCTSGSSRSNTVGRLRRMKPKRYTNCWNPLPAEKMSSSFGRPSSR
jgi:hypothetical protein